MAWEITIGARTRRVDVEEQGGRYVVTVDGEARSVDARRHEPGLLHLLLDGESFEVDQSATPGGFDITLYGTRYAAAVIDERKKALAALSGQGKKAAGEVIRTSMPGKVVAVLVAEGDAVRPGQGLVVVEAMKMENELRAAGDGVVTKVLVAAGQSVEGGAQLIVVGPKEQGHE